MSRYQPPGGRPVARGSARRLRPDETLPGVQFPVVEDLTRITADDEFLDAIAAGGADLRSVFAAAGGNSTGGPSPRFDGSANGRRPVGLGPLLVAWRSELLEPPFPELPTLAPRPMRAPADRSRRRSMRSLLSAGAAICALLMASTAVGAHSAQPGQPLWGLNEVLWSDHANSVEAKVSAQNLLDVAGKAVASHDRTQALAALDEAVAAMRNVDKDDGLGDLQRDYSKLRQQAEQLPPGPDSGASSLEPAGTSGDAGGGRAVGSSSGGLVPAVASSSSGIRTTAPTSPTAPSVRPPGAAAAATTVGGPSAAPGTGAGAVGNPPPPVTNLPIVPVLPATSSSPVIPPNPGTANVGTTAPVTTAPGTTDGSTAPVQPSTPAPVDTTAPTTPAPGTTADPTAPTQPSTPTDPSTTGAPTTDSPGASSSDPSTSSADPTTGASSTDTPTTDAPTSGTTAAPTASTTSEIPTTLDSTPSTDSNGSTLSDTSTTTTQTGPVNSTDGSGTTAGDPATDTTATGEPGDGMARAEQSGQ